MSKISRSKINRKVTASDVAAHAGVSKWMVSRAFTEGASISPSARERVLKAAEELDYRPNLLARSLTTRQTRMIGLVVDELANPNIFLVLDEVTRQLQRQGYMSMLLNITSGNSYRSTLSIADQFQVDGLIFLGTVLTDELVRLAQEIRHIPLIVMYRNCDDPNIQVVSTDGYLAGQRIADVFVEQGYQRVGYMAGPSAQSTRLRRLEGFRNRLHEKGLDVSVILNGEHYQRECGYVAMMRYLEATATEDRVESLFCENDILALGVMDALYVRNETGSVAVIGFDDINEAASPRHNLTTYRQPLKVLVAEAIRRLSVRVPENRHFLAEGQLIIRSSHLRQVPGAEAT